MKSNTITLSLFRLLNERQVNYCVLRHFGDVYMRQTKNCLNRQIRVILTSM